MLAFLTFLLLLVSLFHLFLYFYNRYLLCLRDSPWKHPIHLAWFATSFVLPALLLVLFSSSEAVHLAMIWTPEGLLSQTFFVLFVALIAFAAARFLVWLQRRLFPDKPSNLTDEVIHTPVMPSIPSRLPRGFRRLETTGDLVVTEREIAVAGLAPAFDGITVVQVADVHFGRRLEMENFYEGVQQLVAQLDADIVVLSGDFVVKRRDITRAVEYHAGFRGRLATLCVLGNHDYWCNGRRMLEALEKTHLVWLGGGERRVLKRHGRRLIFTGTDAPWDGKRTDWRRIVRRETGDAVVCLSHTPDNAPVAARHGASLILSGHNHGGQICLPLIGPLVAPSRYGLKYVEGVHRVGVDSVLNVSRGVGVSEEGIRILCKPEICLLRLRAPVVEVMAGRIIPARTILRPLDSTDHPGGIWAN